MVWLHKFVKACMYAVAMETVWYYNADIIMLYNIIIFILCTLRLWDTYELILWVLMFYCIKKVVLAIIFNIYC